MKRKELESIGNREIQEEMKTRSRIFNLPFFLLFFSLHFELGNEIKWRVCGCWSDLHEYREDMSVFAAK